MVDSRWYAWWVVSALVLLAACGGDDDTSPMATDDAGAAPIDDGSASPVSPEDLDGDTISNLDEGDGELDTDGDGTPDSEDADSDGDGRSDAEEAGDDDPGTPPIDTDGDGDPDVRDADSDGDGLSDEDEREAGTDRLSGDTDGDGVSDLVETIAGSDATDAADNPSSRGDFFFLVPYQDDPTPERDTLVFEAAIQKADVLFLIDSSESMQPYIDTVESTLRDSILPGLQAAIPDISFGVGTLDVLPEDVHGDCFGVRNLQASTDDLGAVEAALAAISAQCAGWEPYAQALWLWATGGHEMWETLTDPECEAGRIGMGCARPDALPIVVLLGDESYQDSFRRSDASVGWAPTLDELVAAYREIAARVIIMGPTVTASSVDRMTPDMSYSRLARRTDSVDADGEPLLFGSSSFDSIGNDVVDAITRLATGTTLDVSPGARDYDDDGDMGVDATEFIDRIEVSLAGGPDCTEGLSTEDRDEDSIIETYVDVPGGTPVCFDIVPKINMIVEPSDSPLVFRAAVDIIGDGITVLDSRDVFFLVPPEIEVQVPF